ncbi:MAG: acylneuraminate cytidylyltransferase family protein [Rhodospirillales bacterium]|nr:acylneuraminate cytidylyltransferase family protein [Rhodospirillales bacterium]
MTGVLCIIPARGGSKGVPGKNLRPLGGRPLISYTIEAAKNVDAISDTVMSTEHPMIAEIAASFGATVPFLRPKDMSTDRASLADVVVHGYRYFKNRGREFDAVLCLHPTGPFIKSSTISAAIELLLESKCDSVTTVSQMTQGHPHIAKRLTAQNVITDFCPPPPEADVSSRQSREPAYHMTGGFFLRSIGLMEELTATGNLLGADSRAVCVSEIEATDINTELEFRFAEFLLKEGLV